MSSKMLSSIKFVSYSMENYGPFANRVSLRSSVDFNKKGHLDMNTFEIMDKTYNKVISIYGQNGAGKTTISKAFFEFRKAIISMPGRFQSGEDDSNRVYAKSEMEKAFMYDKHFQQLPTEHAIEFIYNEKLYKYMFKKLNGKVVEEILTRKVKRTEILFKRSSEKYTDIILKSEFLSFKNNLSTVRDDVLCLTVAAFLNNRLADELLHAMLSIDVINGFNRMNFGNISKEDFSQENIIEYLKFLQIADPTLKDFTVKLEEDIVENKDTPKDGLGTSVVEKTIKIEVISKHSVKGETADETVDLPFFAIASDGTKKLFSILPTIFQNLKCGGILVVDEIDNGIHPYIIRKIVDMYNRKETNPYDAQLIFTAHNFSLVSENTRRDQVWVLTKGDDGISRLDRLSAINKARVGANLQKKLESVFGDNPRLDF